MGGTRTECTSDIQVPLRLLRSANIRTVHTPLAGLAKHGADGSEQSRKGRKETGDNNAERREPLTVAMIHGSEMRHSWTQAGDVQWSSSVVVPNINSLCGRRPSKVAQRFGGVLVDCISSRAVGQLTRASCRKT